MDKWHMTETMTHRTLYSIQTPVKSAHTLVYTYLQVDRQVSGLGSNLTSQHHFATPSIINHPAIIFGSSVSSNAYSTA